MVCAVQRLTPEGHDDLVTNLLKVLEPDERLRRQETPTLLADIRAKAKVAELSLIPLFCTTLVLVYKYRSATLPERKSGMSTGVGGPATRVLGHQPSRA